MNTSQKQPSLPIRILVAFIPNFVVLCAAATIIGDAVQSRYFPELAAENLNMGPSQHIGYRLAAGRVL